MGSWLGLCLSLAHLAAVTAGANAALLTTKDRPEPCRLPCRQATQARAQADVAACIAADEFHDAGEKGGCEGYVDAFDVKGPPAMAGPLSTGCLGVGEAPPKTTAEGERIAVRLEVNDWLTSSLVAYAAAVTLKEVLGYDVHFVKYASGAGEVGSPYRVAAGFADAALEYWPASEADVVAAAAVAQNGTHDEPLGVLARLGWFVSHQDTAPPPADAPAASAPATNATGNETEVVVADAKVRRDANSSTTATYWDFYREYARPEVAAKLSRNQEPGKFAPRTFSGANGREAITAIECKAEYCNEPGGIPWQYTPPGYCRDASAGYDEGLGVTPCGDLLLSSPEWDDGRSPALIRNHDLKLSAVYMGDALSNLVRQRAEAKETALFGWWEPDALVREVRAERVTFPTFNVVNDAAHDASDPASSKLAVDWPTIHLRKIYATDRMGASVHFKQALDVLRAFSLSNLDVDTFIDMHARVSAGVDMALYGVTNETFSASALTRNSTETGVQFGARKMAYAAVCEALKSNVGLRNKLITPAIGTIRAPCARGTYFSSSGGVSGITVGGNFVSAPVGTQSGACVACSPGTFSDAVDPAVCTPCPAGFFTDASGQTACKPCPAGTFSTSGSNVCTPCDAGSFSAGQAASCSPCVPGTFQPSRGSAACDTCDLQSYNGAAGATSCTLCPTNTARPFASAPDTVDSCLCIEGTYEPSGKHRGVACSACPDGGMCMGNNPFTQRNVDPFPRADYWGTAGAAKRFSACESFKCNGGFSDIAERLTRAGGDASERLDLMFSFLASEDILAVRRAARANATAAALVALYEADSKAKQLSSGAQVVIWNATSQVYEVAPAIVRTYDVDSANSCKKGYAGRLCQHCAPDYFGIGGACQFKCPSRDNMRGRTAAMALLYAAKWWLWITVFSFLTVLYDALHILITFLQLCNIVGSFSLPFRKEIWWFDRSASVFNFDFDYINPGCTTTWTSDKSMYAQVGLIGGVMTMAGVFYVLARLEVSWRHGVELSERHLSHTKSLGVSSLFLTPRKSTGTNGNVERQVAAHKTNGYQTQRKWLCATSEELGDYLDDLVRYVMLFLVIIYNTICIRAFAAFKCEANPAYDPVLYPNEPERILSLVPTIGCGTAEHNTYRGVAILLIVVFIIGLPLYLTAVYGVGWTNELLNHPSFLRRYGFLYQRYETEYFYWELMLMLRRVGLCYALVFFRDEPYRQALLGFAILIASFSAQVSIKPFRSELIDFIDSAGIYVNTLYIIVGLLSSIDSFKDKGSVSAILLTSIVSVTACGLYGIAREFNGAWIRSKSASFLAKILPSAICQHPQMVETKQTHLLDLLDMAFDTVDRDNSGVVTIEELRFALRNGLDLPTSTVNEVLRNAAVYTQASDANSQETGIKRDKFRQLLMQQILIKAYGETTYESPIERNFSWDPLVAVLHFLRWIYQQVMRAMRKSETSEKMESMRLSMEHKSNMERAIFICTEMIRELRRVGVVGDDAEEAVDMEDVEKIVKSAQNDDDPEFDLVAELLSSFRHKEFQNWIIHEPDSANIIQFHNLDGLMGSYVGDTGYASAYTLAPEALVFNELALQFPYLIDHILGEDDTACDNFREMITSLIRVREDHSLKALSHDAESHELSLGYLVTDIDRGAILHWLVNAPRRRRRQFRDLLESIQAVNFNYRKRQNVKRTLTVGLRMTKSYAAKLFGFSEEEAKLHKLGTKSRPNSGKEIPSSQV